MFIKKGKKDMRFLVYILCMFFLPSVFLGGCTAVPISSVLEIPDDVKEVAASTEEQKENMQQAEASSVETQPQTEEQAMLQNKQPETARLPITEKAEPATEAVSESISEAWTETQMQPVSNGFSVCIDPGHQGSWVDMSAQEPNAPGSSEMKVKCTTGTQGNVSGVPEYQLNLDVSLQLRDELERRGYRVVMTREDNDTAISNSERALLASDSGCDITVRIHANSSTDPQVNGALAMTMAPDNPYVSHLFDSSYRLAQNILEQYCLATGFQNLGVQFYDNMTGINWSKIPVMILEMGFMSNQGDDLSMQDPAMQTRMVSGIVKGIDAYFGINTDQVNAAAQPVPDEDEADPASLGGPLAQIVQENVLPRELNGEKWAISIEPLTGAAAEKGELYEYHENWQMQSASVIKVFIMAAVYDRICYPDGTKEPIAYTEGYEGELWNLINSMITVSDNDAANRLVEILGEGSFAEGAKVVNAFCQENGYLRSKVGRRFLDSNPTDDNYVSSGDCRALLSSLYKGTCVNEEASGKMLSFLKNQTLRWKIPAGLPSSEFASANKTGEMPEGYGLGCIENDIAVIFSPYGDYVLCVLSNDLGGRNEEARQVIGRISGQCAQWFMQGGETAAETESELKTETNGNAEAESETKPNNE